MKDERPVWKRPPRDMVEAVWAVADAVLGQNGQVRLEDITDATGIPRATVYYYFPGRDAFVAWVVEEELRRSIVELAQSESATTGVVPQRRAVQVMMDRWRARPHIAARLLDGLNTAAGTAFTEELARRLSPASSRLRPRPSDVSAAIAIATATLGLALASSARDDTDARGKQVSPKVAASTLDQLVTALARTS